MQVEQGPQFTARIKKNWIITPQEKGTKNKSVVSLKKGPIRSKGNMNKGGIKKEIGDKIHLYFTIFVQGRFKHFRYRVQFGC